MKTYRQLYEMLDDFLPYSLRNDGEAWWKGFERLDMKYNQGIMTTPHECDDRCTVFAHHTD